ncbi:SpoIID/LytB domain-containing protein [Adhaeretor mobilis]|uniref:Stage II sporulation protein n=1 Tax=Adhaeretor mobilis TaxID=1930276 RepID=A0A517MTR1_9BACT|nr:SpoIID/LytB domain-containing protein [Adhaeretor mobilis]QDS98269.1 Stage II sporulation protein [Adhaeretor mobilis]
MPHLPRRVLAFSLIILGIAGPPAWAQFTALSTINVTGSGNVATETDYVPNVCNCENGAASFEALKAQAVAARTFAYYKMDLQGFINDGTSDQVYSCAGSAGSLQQAAAAATEGEILYVFDNIGATQGDVLIASFYVAGAIPTGPFNPANPGVIVDPGDNDPTNTERFVTYTYADGLVDGFNTGTSLGFNGTVSNPNWPNRGAKSQNGADYLSDNSTSYLDILKYYYGADIQLRTATTTGTGIAFGTKTLVDFDDYGDRSGTTFSGHEGTFGWAPTFSGSTSANVGGSTAVRSNVESHSGGHSQLLDITYDEESGTDFFVRHISGAQYSDFGGSTNVASRIANLQFESIGSVGFWLKTDDPDMQVSIAIDDPTTADRGSKRSVIADNLWHKYEWFLDEDSDWESWIAGGNGQIDGENVSIDSIQFFGSSDAQIFLDDVFWNPQAVFVPPTPGDFDADGDVGGDDLAQWQGDYGVNGNSDADDDDDSDGMDFLIWQQNYALTSSTAASNAVPEPSSLAMILLAGTTLLSRKRLID